MGLSPKAVNSFLDEYGELRDGICYNKKTNKKIAACMPMHTFGFPVHLDELITICTKWNIPIVEDAAESIGSEYKNKPTGSFGKLGIYSFNGNKVVTCGGGGVIMTNDIELGNKAKHLTTTAKVPHPYEYVHDEIGYNYRMPNLNAALACAQLEQLDSFIQKKRILANNYKNYFNSIGVKFRTELTNTKANYWLMCVELKDKSERDLFLKESNTNKVMTRPIWQLIFKSPLYSNFQKDAQTNAMYLEERIVNIPSSVIL
jgi:dTDP-4-amino-4,6-dideoxygalactose transaminase